MSLLALHHVSIITADLGKSLPFYCDVFGLTEISRPISGGRSVARLRQPANSSRRASRRYVPPAAHDRPQRLTLRFRTDDFEGTIKRLAALGFREDLPEDDPKCLRFSALVWPVFHSSTCATLTRMSWKSMEHLEGPVITRPRTGNSRAIIEWRFVST
ncbi:VOC family protein [Ensifer sp. MPMI2T]|nr:VOC family protein [Ensifer sp. MPMI2T]